MAVSSLIPFPIVMSELDDWKVYMSFCQGPAGTASGSAFSGITLGVFVFLFVVVVWVPLRVIFNLFGGTFCVRWVGVVV